MSNKVDLTKIKSYEDIPDSGNPRYKKRIKFCERCGEAFVPRGSRATCCDECAAIRQKEKALERYYKNGRKQTSAHNWKVINGKRVYVHSGYNQQGKNNNNYKDGKAIDWFAEALKVLPNKCNRCGITEEEIQKNKDYNCRGLLLHHKDGNHYNNVQENWEILCKKCHQNHHTVRDKKTGRFVSNKV